jgi:hypothetical protein
MASRTVRAAEVAAAAGSSWISVGPVLDPRRPRVGPTSDLRRITV